MQLLYTLQIPVVRLWELFISNEVKPSSFWTKPYFQYRKCDQRNGGGIANTTSQAFTINWIGLDTFM